MQNKTVLLIATIALAAFAAGRWTGSRSVVRADSGDNPQIHLETIRGDTSLTLYYPSLKQLFVYQTPFVGLPSWGCSYSIKLSTPGGKIERNACPNPGQQF